MVKLKLPLTILLMSMPGTVTSSMLGIRNILTWKVSGVPVTVPATARLVPLIVAPWAGRVQLMLICSKTGGRPPAELMVRVEYTCSCTVFKVTAYPLLAAPPAVRPWASAIVAFVWLTTDNVDSPVTSVSPSYTVITVEGLKFVSVPWTWIICPLGYPSARELGVSVMDAPIAMEGINMHAISTRVRIIDSCFLLLSLVSTSFFNSLFLLNFCLSRKPLHSQTPPYGKKWVN